MKLIKEMRRKARLVAFFLTILLSFSSATSQARTADNIKYSSSGQTLAAEVGSSILGATTTQIQDALGLLPSDVISISNGTSDTIGFEVFSTLATLFPTQGSDYFLMSTGAAADALTANASPSTSTVLNGLNNSQDEDMPF